MRQISKPDAAAPVQVRLEKDFISRIDEVAKNSGQSSSAVIRAAIRLGLRALEESPDSVRLLEAGTLNTLPKEEYGRVYLQLLRIEANPSGATSGTATYPLLFHTIGSVVRSYQNTELAEIDERVKKVEKIVEKIDPEATSVAPEIEEKTTGVLKDIQARLERLEKLRGVFDLIAPQAAVSRPCSNWLGR